MKTQIDLKSALCGLAVGVLAMLAIGATDSPYPIGRYQGVSGQDNLLAVVDTATGQVWAHRAGGSSITGTPPGFWEKKVDK